MPDVSSAAPVVVNQWIVFDVHKNSLVAGVLPASGGTPEVSRIENTERAIRRFIERPLTRASISEDEDALAVVDAVVDLGLVSDEGTYATVACGVVRHRFVAMHRVAAVEVEGVVHAV
jgi:hypothetical protein